MRKRKAKQVKISQEENSIEKIVKQKKISKRTAKNNSILEELSEIKVYSQKSSNEESENCDIKVEDHKTINKNFDRKTLRKEF
jgi:hypothetical protein